VQSQTDVSCQGGNDGSAAVTLTGGTGPFGYAWSPSGGTAAQATGLAAGNYSVLITDALGCQGVVPIVIAEPAALLLAKAVTPSSCGGLPDGTASVVPTGGTAPYQYQWSS